MKSFSVIGVSGCLPGSPSTGPGAGGAMVGTGVSKSRVAGVVGAKGASRDEQPANTQAAMRTDDKMTNALRCFILQYHLPTAANGLSNGGTQL